MHSFTRSFIAVPALLLSVWGAAAASLPFSTVFKGADRFESLVQQAERDNWRALPIGERTAAVGKALLGVPYVSYTLEIDDRIEAVSVNLNGLDCWTFFEAALGFARLIQAVPGTPTPAQYLKMIELDRYHDGVCTGDYLSRLHFLEEWIEDNERRGLVRNITRELGGVRMDYRRIREMTAGWKGYRYLRNNKALIPRMAEREKEVSAIPVYYIPKKRVPAIESKLQNGDIICITTSWPGSYTSHVGLALRDSKGVLRFMHATSSRDKGRKTIVDARLSAYLAGSKDRSGIYVARPNDVPPQTLSALGF